MEKTEHASNIDYRDLNHQKIQLIVIIAMTVYQLFSCNELVVVTLLGNKLCSNNIIENITQYSSLNGLISQN